MKTTILSILALASTVFQPTLAQAQTRDTTSKTGWTGTLSSLDGGLGGTVVVTDTNTLTVNNYKLEDGSAPALYWWGSTSDNLADGFRISNKQVDGVASSDTYTIMLDAGKTAADFATVGLWCERFSVNFGQAKLAPAEEGAKGGDAGTEDVKPSQTGSAGAAKTMPSAGVANTVGWGVVYGAAVGFALALVF